MIDELKQVTEKVSLHIKKQKTKLMTNRELGRTTYEKRMHISILDMNCEWVDTIKHINSKEESNWDGRHIEG